MTPSTARRLRLAVLLCIICAAVAATYWLRYTDAGSAFRHQHHARAWLRAHPFLAPLCLVGAYAVLASLGLPVWEVQVAAGYCFGLVGGVWWSEVGAALGALGGYTLSRWLAGSWFRAQAEARMPALRRLTARLDHNGFLLVMACRLMHVVPFGLSNYAFAMLGVGVADVMWGSFLGNIPTATLCAGIGAGYHPWTNTRFLLGCAGLSVAMTIPVALRYWRPQWFKKVGVE